MITYSIETITPQIAAEYLKSNTENYRTINNKIVDAYAEDMRSGKWETNGETISFLENGTLFNGQHRLNAVVKSGTAIQFLVVRGLPNETKIADWGKTRSINSWGKHEGIVISTQIAGAVKTLLFGFDNAAQAKGVQVTFIKNHYEELHESELIATSGSRHGLGRRSPMVLAVYVIRKLNIVNDDIMTDFFRVLNTGTVLPDERRDPSPPLTLYRQITRDYYRISGGCGVKAEQYNFVFQAILDYAKNKNRRIAYKMKNEPINCFNKVHSEIVLNKGE